jgi:hypothetical protein
MAKKPLTQIQSHNVNTRRPDNNRQARVVPFLESGCRVARLMIALTPRNPKAAIPTPIASPMEMPVKPADQPAATPHPIGVVTDNKLYKSVKLMVHSCRCRLMSKVNRRPRKIKHQSHDFIQFPNMVSNYRQTRTGTRTSERDLNGWEIFGLALRFCSWGG